MADGSSPDPFAAFGAVRRTSQASQPAPANNNLSMDQMRRDSASAAPPPFVNAQGGGSAGVPPSYGAVGGAMLQPPAPPTTSQAFPPTTTQPPPTQPAHDPFGGQVGLVPMQSAAAAQAASAAHTGVPNSFDISALEASLGLATAPPTAQQPQSMPPPPPPAALGIPHVTRQMKATW